MKKEKAKKRQGHQSLPAFSTIEIHLSQHLTPYLGRPVTRRMGHNQLDRIPLQRQHQEGQHEDLSIYSGNDLIQMNLKLKLKQPLISFGFDNLRDPNFQSVQGHN